MTVWHTSKYVLKHRENKPELLFYLILTFISMVFGLFVFCVGVCRRVCVRAFVHIFFAIGVVVVVVV